MHLNDGEGKLCISKVYTYIYLPHTNLYRPTLFNCSVELNIPKI